MRLTPFDDLAVRRWTRRDGTVTETYTVRFKDVDGTKRRRSFDTVDDALDVQGETAQRAALAAG